ncbi:MAG: hypothetical protein FAF03_03765 [Epsilonproteobacteria bacterium]|nr:hypothetical protein [Campylobacterota bacterium]
MSNKFRVQKLETIHSKDEMVVFISPELDETMPKGSILKRVFNGTTVTDTILSEAEYLKEVSNHDNIINVGGKIIN